MLVKDFVEHQLALKPYKYQTKINIRRCLQKLAIWDVEYKNLPVCNEYMESNNQNFIKLVTF